MRKRINQLKLFYYDGPNIRDYCMKFLTDADTLYRIFYYDTEPLKEKGHNPFSKRFIDFSKTSVAQKQEDLFRSLRKTPNFALRLGKTVWRNNGWVLRPDKFNGLINRKIVIEDLTEEDLEPHIEQKAVDMKIGLDIALIAMKKLADLLIVISGDADTVPALKLARREGMQVGLDPLGCKIQPDLEEHVDFIASKIKQYQPLLFKKVPAE